MVAFASSLDQCGPLTRDVTDAALLLQAMQGRDPRDSTSTGIEGGVALPRRERPRRPADSASHATSPDHAEGRRAGRRGDLRSRRCGWSRARRRDRRDRAAARRARDLRLLRDRARRGVGEPRPLRRRPLRPARGRRRRPRRHVRAHPRAGFGAEVKRRIMLGTVRALVGLLRGLLRQRAEGADDDRAGLRTRVRGLRPRRSRRPRRRSPSSSARGPTTRWRCTCPTTSRCRCRWPGSRRSRSRRARRAARRRPRLPVGLQIAAPAFAETELLDAAYALEAALGLPGRPR